VIAGVTDANGQFSVTFTSASTGLVTGTATSNVNVGGLVLPRTTNGTGSNSGPATKRFVDAKIVIEPDDTNEVGQPHTFTVTVFADNGDGIDNDGVMGTFDAVGAGEDVSVTLDGTNGAVPDLIAPSNLPPADPTVIAGVTNASGQFSVTFTSATTGLVTGTATSNVNVGGLVLPRTTDGTGNNSDPAVKRFVDAKIVITPDDSNEVGDDHTFTVTVFADNGDGIDNDGVMGTFDAVGAGEDVSVTLDGQNGAIPDVSAPSNLPAADPTVVAGVTNASGQFSVTFTSAIAGLVVGTATSNVDVGGLVLPRTTNGTGNNSGPAFKRFVDARITISPDDVNPVGAPHTFIVTVQQDDGLLAAQGGDGVTGFAPASGANVTVTLDGVGGAVPDVSAPSNLPAADPTVVMGSTNASGQFSVTFTSATPGDVIGNASAALTVGGVAVVRDTDPTTAGVGAGPGGSGPATKKFVRPGIDIEKTTNGPTNSNPIAPDFDNEDAENGPGVPILTPGSTLTWTYKVTNTGGTNYAMSDVVIVDDNGTPGNAADDMSTTNGQITFQSVAMGDADNILEPGEMWLYTASGIVQNVGSGGSSVTFDLSGNSALDGPDGNIRTFTAGGISVNASAFSRDFAPAGSGTWSTAFLGAYDGGLGVTDAADGTGANNSHTVDNIDTLNFVLFEFSETVVIDSAFLGFVAGDSDLHIWIGTVADPFNNHQTLSDAFLAGLGFNEPNDTALTTTRTADVNAGGVSGNVIVIAASITDTSPDDKFKIEKLKVSAHGCYENKAVVTVPDGSTDSDLSHYCNPDTPPPDPDIDIEKTTNGPTNSNPVAPDFDNEDAENGPGVPILTPGSAVTWTYKVTNTGNVDFAFNQVVIVDDNGTPGNNADDMSTTGGQITFLSVQSGDADNILEPGEIWLYKATGTVQNVGSAGPAVTFDFSGSSATDGADGNIRTFTAGGVSVKASAFSRDTSGVWQTGFLGSYAGGLGVTDRSEDGANDTHTVDNLDRDNYVLFEFSETVVVDSAFLGYVVGDSDLRIWIGTKTDPFNNHQTLSDAFLTSLGFTELDETTLTTTRTADVNAGGISGNVLVIAANPDEPTNEDNFKIEKVKVNPHGCYENKAVVTVPGDTDSDLSHYCNPLAPPPNPGIDIKKFTNGVDADTAAEAPQIAPGATVTWTYKVTNTGNVAFNSSDVVVRDDNGTPSNTSDDFNAVFDSFVSGDTDNLLEPGEMWLYKKTGVAQNLTSPGSSSTFVFSGNTSTNGSAGNIRTFSAGGLSVKASGFSRDSSGNWSTAFLGNYAGGLGVTDGSEDGSNNTHTVDNVGRNNYVLFEFSESVVIDSAFLGFVVDDSDLHIWIGNVSNAFNNHQTLSDAFLAGLGFNELNDTTSASPRTADVNADQVSGNVIVISSSISDASPDDRFKIEKLNVSKVVPGIYKNIGKVTAGSVSDTDPSHYKNPPVAPPQTPDPDCVDLTLAFTGSTATTGTHGNIRTFSQNGVSVNVSAFSRTNGGTWSTAYVGAYSDGLGVTDASENGSGGTHRVDNIDRWNFVLFEFSTLVEVDRAFLNSVVTDSDISVFIGTANNPFHNHLTLSDSLIGMISLSEDNDTTSSSGRWADFNDAGIFGNVLVIASSLSDSTPDDQFKIEKLDVCAKTVKFYTVDATAKDTFEYGPTGQALANYDLNSGNTNPRGVATTAANTKVWVIDGNKKVYVYDTNGVLAGSWTANGLTTPEDITTNGSDIWIVDDGSNKVFRYNSNAANRTSGSQNAASSFNLNSANANAKGIVTDGTHLWVVNDNSTDKVFKYTLSGSLVGSWTIDSRNGSPTGITIDPANPNHIWIVDSADKAVYRYNGAIGRSSGSQAADIVFNLSGTNGNAQGIADPPPGGSDAALASELTLPVSHLALADWTADRPSLRHPRLDAGFAEIGRAIQPSNRSALKRLVELASFDLDLVNDQETTQHLEAKDAAFYGFESAWDDELVWDESSSEEGLATALAVLEA
jgi:hypothetical protein